MPSDVAMHPCGPKCKQLFLMNAVQLNAVQQHTAECNAQHHIKLWYHGCSGTGQTYFFDSAYGIGINFGTLKVGQVSAEKALDVGGFSKFTIDSTPSSLRKRNRIASMPLVPTALQPARTRHHSSTSDSAAAAVLSGLPKPRRVCGRGGGAGRLQHRNHPCLPVHLRGRPVGDRLAPPQHWCANFPLLTNL